jgi:hypothetical protein
MSDEKPRREKPAIPTPEAVEQGVMVQLGREAVEAVGADAVLIVWTKQRRRKTYIHSATIGNGLAVQGLMRWCHAKIEELDGADEEDDEDDEDEED